MAKVVAKTILRSVDGTPKKRMFLSIISDYDLKTGLCELIDNALDFWVSNGMAPGLQIDVRLDTDRQVIQVQDNAGGVKEEDAELLVAPGASRNEVGGSSIGIFGVGSKRAGVALGEQVEIRTRHKNGKSIQIEITNDWIASPNWDLVIYEIPPIAPSTTVVDISKIRQRFEKGDVEQIRQHFGETYSWFIRNGCTIAVNGHSVPSLEFEKWAYPPEYLPRVAEFQIEPVDSRFLDVRLVGGLILDRDSERENYGVYFYCNSRLIVKELKVRDVGYFVSAEAGVPHPDASLCRVIVHLKGPAELMPWNSSKSGINFGNAAFHQLRKRIIDYTSYYTGISRRLKTQWDTSVLKYTTGALQVVEPTDALSDKKTVLPKLPRSRSPSRMEVLRERNKKTLRDQPWVTGLIEAMGFVDILARQKYETKNRVALILLDSNFEIALKEFIVHRKDLFPAHKYTNQMLVSLFANRTNVIKEVTAHVPLSSVLLAKVGHYYDMRNNLTHQRASVQITDQEVKDYTEVIETVLSKLFPLKFPK